MTFCYYEDPDVQVNENHVKFMATGVGARGTQLYEFELELGAHIVPIVGRNFQVKLSFLSLLFIIVLVKSV